MRSENQRDEQELNLYYWFAKSHHLEAFDALKMNWYNTPFQEVPNEVQFLKTKQLMKPVDEQNMHWKLVSNDNINFPAKFHLAIFVRSRIRDMVINNSKTDTYA